MTPVKHSPHGQCSSATISFGVDTRAGAVAAAIERRIIRA